MKLYVNYNVNVTYTVEIERETLPTEEDLIDSITKDELVNGDGELTWDAIKDAWRYSDPTDIIITDDEFNELYL